MGIVAAVAITAVLVSVIVAQVVRRQTRARVTDGIGGRKGADPVAEHERLLREAVQGRQDAETRRDLLQLSFNALSSGVVVTGPGGKVLARNQLAADANQSAHERTLIDAAIKDLLAESQQRGRTERELEIFGPPNRMLALHAVPITADGERVGSLAVIDDITELHRTDKTRRDFVANLSHELRTPVGAASLLGEMLVEEVDPEVRRQLTERLLVETARMTTTIDDLLALSRIESAEQPYDETVRAHALVNEALDRTRVAAETKGVEVAAVVSDQEASITGNHDQLLTALVNLVENAIKYSSPGDSVTVRAHGDANEIQLVVQDTGRGIPARDLDRIFERFYRVDRSRDSATGGTGIGLSIVRHVALNHGGTVEVSSFEGEGSTFTMALPVSSEP